MTIATESRTWRFPVIRHFGKVLPLPEGTALPRTGKLYKVLVSVVQKAAKDEEPLPGLLHAANAVNVFSLAGVDVTHHLQLKAIVYGPSILGVLRNEHYLPDRGRES